MVSKEDSPAGKEKKAGKTTAIISDRKDLVNMIRNMVNKIQNCVATPHRFINLEKEKKNGKAFYAQFSVIRGTKKKLIQ